MAKPTLEQVLNKRYALDAKLSEMTARHKAEAAPITDAIKKLDEMVNAHRIKNGWSNQKLENGRTVKVNKTRQLAVKAAKWVQFFKWASEQPDGHELFTKKVAKNNMINLEKEGIDWPDCVEETVIEKLSFS
jgi:hypothetical protein